MRGVEEMMLGIGRKSIMRGPSVWAEMVSVFGEPMGYSGILKRKK